MTAWRIVQGDCLELLARMKSDCIDSLVTDPPAGISFMGKSWDDPKGYGYSDSGNRIGAPPGINLSRNPTCQTCGGRRRAGPATKGCSCEHPDFNDRTLRLRDRSAFIAILTPIFEECYRIMKPGAHGLVWSLPRTSHWTATALEDSGFEIRDCCYHIFGTGWPKSSACLKPAVECWWLIRKPLSEKSVSENVLLHGTGALNIDVCRLEGRERTEYGLSTAHRSQGVTYGEPSSDAGFDSGKGRWPPHLLLSEDAADEMDQQSGMSRSVKGRPRRSAVPGAGYGMVHTGTEYNDAGGASRFFPIFRYQAKPSSSEKNAGLDERNLHPTVKSIELMRWLIRLITPPRGVVLDPFCGSGSTGCAAILEGFRFIGFEKDTEHVETSKKRIEYWAHEKQDE